MMHNESAQFMRLSSNIDEEAQNMRLLRDQLTQPALEGSQPFFSMCSLCCLFTLIIPITLLTIFTSTMHTSTKSLALVSFAAILLAIGVCYFVWTMRYLIIISPPAAAPFIYPLVHPVEVRPPKNVYILVNPVSGKLKSRRVYETILVPKLKAAGITYTTIETQYSGHAEVLCRDLDLNGFDTIVAIGGDGTLHECVNGLMKRDVNCLAHVAFAIIPSGSGNSFLTDFGLQSDAGFLVDTLVRGEIAKVDVGRVVYGPNKLHHTRYSINVVYFTPDHCGSALNAEKWRWLLGTMRYDICSFWGILKLRDGPVDVLCDGKLWKTRVMFLLTNTTQVSTSLSSFNSNKKRRPIFLYVKQKLIVLLKCNMFS
eukprot:c9218_g1_i2.p1 GENE.c9218_g1_i2~~c9218_g1_i2.p1  ORF type:complete len:380 (-),score=80.32 c9218_g1_i2:575-1681(-)